MEEKIKIEITKEELLIIRNALTELSINTYYSIEILEDEVNITEDKQGYYKTKRRKERLLDKYNNLAIKIESIIDNNK